MHFDKFLGMIERTTSLNALDRDVSQNSNLFVFEELKDLKALMPAEVGRELFHLPFRVTAVEDRYCLVIFQDSEEKQLGFATPRKFVIFYPEAPILQYNLDTQVDLPRERVEALLAQAITNQSAVMVQGDISNVTWDSYDIYGTVNLEIYRHYHKNGLHAMFSAYTPQGKSVLMTHAAMLNSMVFSALINLIVLCEPQYFVVEESPIRTPKKTNGKKYPRTHERPLYTFLTAKQFRQKAGILPHYSDTQGRPSPTPHERRAHLRRLSTDGGHFKENRVVHVKSTWVGQTEQVVGHKRYKVLLDI